MQFLLDESIQLAAPTEVMLFLYMQGEKFARVHTAWNNSLCFMVSYSSQDKLLAPSDPLLHSWKKDGWVDGIATPHPNTIPPYTMITSKNLKCRKSIVNSGHACWHKS